MILFIDRLIKYKYFLEIDFFLKISYYIKKRNNKYVYVF